MFILPLRPLKKYCCLTSKQSRSGGAKLRRTNRCELALLIPTVERNCKYKAHICIAAPYFERENYEIYSLLEISYHGQIGIRKAFG